jgi:hypothetical protein
LPNRLIGQMPEKSRFGKSPGGEFWTGQLQQSPFTGNSRDIRFALADHGIDTGTFRRMSFLKMERAALAAAL